MLHFMFETFHVRGRRRSFLFDAIPDLAFFDISCSRSKEIRLFLDAIPRLAFFDTKGLGCLVFQELCQSLFFVSLPLERRLQI